MGKPLFQLLAIVVAISISTSNGVTNGTKPVIFRTSPFPNNASDSGNSESINNPQFVSSNVASKQVVSSQGYQLEVIDDSSSEDSKNPTEEESTQKATDRQISVYPSNSPEDAPLNFEQYSRQAQYVSGLSKDEINAEYIPKSTIAYSDIQPKTDISKVRDIFVHKEIHVPEQTQTPLVADPTQSYPSSSAPQYKLEYDNSPIKYVESPVLVRPNGLPETESASAPQSHPLPHPHLHHHSHHHSQHDDDEEITGHTAGYGHGYHHHQQKLKSKPLKPSVVYRDPADGFDEDDKIRTLDRDHVGRGRHHPFGPHHPSLDGKSQEYDYHHEKGLFKPEYYDETAIPECAHKNKYIYNLTFCVDDPHYPTEAILWAIKKAGPDAKKLLVDVTYQSADNLLTGLTRAEEEGYTYKHYFGATHAQNLYLDRYKPPYKGYTYSTDYYKKGGYLCPSDIYYTRPKRAMNTHGKWKVIVNVENVPHFGWDHQGHSGHSDEHNHEGKTVDIGHGIYEKNPHHYHHHHQHKHHIFHNDLHEHHHEEKYPHHEEKHPPLYYHHSSPHDSHPEKAPHHLHEEEHSHPPPPSHHEEKHPPQHYHLPTHPLPDKAPHHLHQEEHSHPPPSPHHHDEEKHYPHYPHHEEIKQSPPQELHDDKHYEHKLPPPQEENYIIHHDQGSPHHPQQQQHHDEKHVIYHQQPNQDNRHLNKQVHHQDQTLYHNSPPKGATNEIGHPGYTTGDSYSSLHSIKKREPQPEPKKKREHKKTKKSYTQTVRLEQCIYPNAPCSFVDSHYHSSCIQKHNFVRLVAYTPDEGIHVDVFKMPIACSCHVREPIHFYHQSGLHEHKHGHVVPPVKEYH